ncbi:hypothetical protein ScPMuIL_003616 [Solemya velum]
MASNRAPSVGSNSSSAGEIPIVQGLSKKQPLPEEWTLPKEWNIEKRELFDNWKVDVQNQIANISGSLERSLETFPHPDVESTSIGQYDWQGGYLPTRRPPQRHHRY